MNKIVKVKKPTAFQSNREASSPSRDAIKTSSSSDTPTKTTIVHGRDTGERLITASSKGYLEDNPANYSSQTF